MKVVGNRGRLRVGRKPEDFSPMEGVGNMADAMLVFACGLLLALILSWNVNIGEDGRISNSGGATYEINGIDGTVTTEIDANTPLEEMGPVYRDPATGKYYVMAQ